MYKLYLARDSGVRAPQALLEEIGAEYEKLVIDFEKDEHRSDEFLSVKPMGQIPALVLPDGTLMTETAAILLQIVDRHPEAQLAPTAGSTERTRFLRWSKKGSERISNGSGTKRPSAVGGCAPNFDRSSRELPGTNAARSRVSTALTPEGRCNARKF